MEENKKFVIVEDIVKYCLFLILDELRDLEKYKEIF